MRGGRGFLHSGNYSREKARTRCSLGPLDVKDSAEKKKKEVEVEMRDEVLDEKDIVGG